MEAPKSMIRLEFRHPTKEDIPSMVAIWNDSIADLPSQLEVTSDELMAMTFLDSDYDPQGAWLAFAEGEAVGYSCGFVDRARLEYGLNDSYVDIEVMHTHRRTGIEEELLDRACGYLARQGVGATQIPHYQMDTWKADLLRNAGFREVRRYFEMIWGENEESLGASFPVDLRIERRVIDGDYDYLASRIADIRNESFVDHYNYAPMPAQRLRNYLASAHTTFAATFVLDGERTIGFAMNEDRHPETSKDGKREGWVAILGVVNSHRRRGLGRNLLLDSVDWLRSREAERIMLLVDAENEKALGMYKSVGFEVHIIEILMKKDLGDGEGQGRSSAD